ncbi:hypothetical protein, partial [Moorena sp. SIO1F2]|uniref:hypothetical protein n=1 Tax=Moorena sp. SIO1F2 TaxID=2607819 RepID=UPI0025CF9D61
HLKLSLIEYKSMSIISEIKNKKLGLVEILVLGHEIYLKNIKLHLTLFCALIISSSLPIIFLINYTITQNFNLILILVYFLYICFYLLVFGSIYSMSVAAATENFLLKRETRFQTLMSRIFPDIGTLVNLTFRLSIAFILRLFLLVVPGIIYLVNNGFCIYAFVLRGQKGKAAFNYSRTIVKGNWWRVFLFLLLVLFSALGLQIILTQVLNTIPFINYLSALSLSTLITQFILIGVSIGSVLLFLNLDYNKSLEK